MKTRGITAQQNDDYVYDTSTPATPTATTSTFQPLSKCPLCPKTFSTLRSLYGHFGAAHKAKLNQERVLYACPYCTEEVEYTTLEKVREHVGEVHEEIDLDMEEVVSGGGTPRPGGQPAMDLSEESSSKTISCHALGKCPNCPRVLPLRALFGHFGRVHSGQLGGESNKFHWSRVSYLCPFCAEDESNDEENAVVYSTHEELGEHVGREHEGCVLIPLGPSARNSMNEDDEEGKAVPASPPVAVRSSQRQRQRQRQRNAAAAAAANNDELTPTDPTGPSTTQILYNCPSCEREKTFTKQGLIDHYAKVHNTPLNWDKVTTAQVEGTSFICPECNRSFKVKAGLATHYGMSHDGKLDWDKVEIQEGLAVVPSLKRKRESSEDDDDGEEEDDEDGQVRKSRRISERAASRRNVEDEDNEYEYDAPFATAAGGSGGAPMSGSAGLNYGPWTEEEHAAFLMGHEKYRNNWKIISEEFVPTRTPKQVGSHGFAHFTALGKWESRRGKEWPKSGYEMEQVADERALSVRHVLFGCQKVDAQPNKEEIKPAKERRRSLSNAKPDTEAQGKRNVWTAEEHAAFIEGHRKLGNSWMLISQQFVPSRTPKQVGSHALHYFTAKGMWEEAKKSKKLDPSVYEDEYNEEENSHGHSDDGNFDYCIVCEDGGDIICCNDCPRSYHSACITNTSVPLNSDELPSNWVCDRCTSDAMVLSEDKLPEDVPAMNIQSAYSPYLYSEGFEQCCKLLTKMYLIVCKLRDSDLGYIFSEPVDLEIAPNYTKKISCPMDYGTILTKVESGEYKKELKPLMKYPMETVILRVINDIELVYKNCESYNPKGSSVYRSGKCHSKKWTAFFNRYLLGSLPEKVIISYRKGILEIEEAPHVIEEPQQDEGHKQEKEAKPKKKKRVDKVTASSGVVLTKDQLDALENVFFSPTSALTDPICDPNPNPKSNTGVQRSQWYERLEDLRKYKLEHTTAIVSISQNDSLYQWTTRTRKRYHLTMFHKPDFRSQRNIDFTGQSDNDADTSWLIQMPSMTGAFSLEGGNVSKKKSSVQVFQDDTASIAADIKIAESIHNLHQQERYYPTNSIPPYRHSSSLFFDECLEELRFFRGEHKHTIVPKYPAYNEKLSLWVNTQRAKLLLYLVGIDSGMLGSQMFVLDDELHLCDFRCSPLATTPSVDGTGRKNNIPEPIESEDIQDEVDEKPVSAPVSYSSIGVLQNANNEPPTEVISNPPTEAGSTGKEVRAPLCKCTACDKSFHALRKLYGHFGSAHSRIAGLKINTEDVLFACPFCDELLFKPMKEIEAHIEVSHPNCQLSKSEYQMSPSATKTNRPKDKTKPKAPSSPKKIPVFKKHLNDFVNWHQQHPFPSRDTMSKDLYSWCWRQCNGASALLLGTPNVNTVKMTATKLKLLATNGFFRTFPYTDKELVCENEYEGSGEWDEAFEEVERFSMKHGSTHIPRDYNCSPATRTWIMNMSGDLNSFIKGEHCELSIQQIEKLILIGFCNDRAGLPNLTRSDVIWLKRYRELRQYQSLFGDCHVSEDFPQLYQWVNEQKILFRQFRIGKDELVKVDRLAMLVDAGLDFVTTDYFPRITEDCIKDFEKQIATPPDLFKGNESLNVANGLIDDDMNDDDDFVAKYEGMKASNGHCLVTADENLDVYQWFIAMRSALLDSYAIKFDADKGYTLFHHLVLSYVKDDDWTSNTTVGHTTNPFKTKESLMLWTKYCERFFMFVAVKGHCHIPKDYPDIPLLQWLSKQQDELYLHCSKYSLSELPLHLKVLVSVGLQGKKRDIQSTMSSRIMTRKFPAKAPKAKRSEK